MTHWWGWWGLYSRWVVLRLLTWSLVKERNVRVSVWMIMWVASEVVSPWEKIWCLRITFNSVVQFTLAKNSGDKQKMAAAQAVRPLPTWVSQSIPASISFLSSHICKERKRQKWWRLNVKGSGPLLCFHSFPEAHWERPPSHRLLSCPATMGHGFHFVKDCRPSRHTD